jgi:hypothetical protein
MTLVRKNMISGSTWHYFYAGSLGMIFLIPVVTVLRLLFQCTSRSTVAQPHQLVTRSD